MADVHGSFATVEALKGLVGELASVCLDLEPRDLLARHAGQVIELTAAMERYLAGARTLAVFQAVSSGVWRDEGARSPQQWLAAKRGCTVTEAARIVATAERVQAQPKTRDAMREGRLSDDEADAVTGATEAEPDREDEHLHAATGSTPPGTGPSDGTGDGDGDDTSDSTGPGEPGSGSGSGGGGGSRESVADLRRRRERAKARADLDAAAKEARLHAERTAGRGPTDTGGYTMWMRTTKAAGLRFNTAWDLAMGEIQAERTAAGLAPLTYGQLCADALTRVADKSLTSPDGSGSTDGSRGPGRPAQRGILFADIAALQHGVAQGDETCQIPGVGTISVPTARDLLGDATLTLVIRDGIDVRNVTNLGPTFTAAQRTAIWARAGGVCERPDCNTTTGLEIDHDHEVQYGGPSDIANASLKCWPDHQDKTHHGWRLIGPPGRKAWVHLNQLPADPARQHIPQDDIEHLLPPPAPTSASPAPPDSTRPPAATRHGPEPPARAAPPTPTDPPSMRNPPAGHPAPAPAAGEQLDLLTT